ncbi:alpha/beta hydrolase [Mycobacterium sp. 236(2023)]|uniref:alpha/beta hydrolase n=1 Tax=Mycobacterium sp. 236(2023) TaxID=3038163 RepID=UPI002414E1E2|nr:alpha/beta hydrolase [Mycobacterium sp. 236(2023)]MDG4664020.1 alpha/beta hydrolase [Mycobacterium sp. 236(2023)]
MDYRAYAEFLPAAYTDNLIPPVSTWWQWRDTHVHIARSQAPEAAVRAMVIHGGGGHSGALWPVSGMAADEGFEVFAPDLPLFGDTVPADASRVRYDDWVDLLSDLVRAERTRDPRPLILFGASMGGMLAYEVAARTRDIAAVVATCLLDMRDSAARAAATRYPWMGRSAPHLLPALTPVLGRLRVPLRWLEDMDNMSNDPRLSQLCASDPRGGGGSAPLGFLSSFMTYTHTVPEQYRGAPVTLVAPAADKWTPPELSIRFMQRISARTELVMLENCGHFPIEEPGLTQLRDAMRTVLSQVQAGRP